MPMLLPILVLKWNKTQQHVALSRPATCELLSGTACCTHLPFSCHSKNRCFCFGILSLFCTLCCSTHTKKKTHEHYNLEMQTGFLLISLIWSNYDMLGGQRLGIAVSPAEFRLGFSCRCRFWRFLRSLPLERSGALIAGKRDFLS